MKKFIFHWCFLFLLILFSSSFLWLNGQNAIICTDLNPADYWLCDDFSDGNFSSTPAWEGQTDKFIINSSSQLQLNNEGITDTAYLTTPLGGDLSETVEWRFHFNLEFNPSNNNFLRIYLIADQADLNGFVNGYYLQMGETGSDDAIELYRQSGSATELILRGTDGLVSAEPDRIVKVIRDVVGNWELYTAASESAPFELEASGMDAVWTDAAYMGVWCRHTQGNALNFFFDYFYAGDLVVDTKAPEYLSFEAIDGNTIVLQFSEVVEPGDVGNYVLNGTSSPITAVSDDTDASMVILTFDSTFLQGDNVLTISSISDLAGNSATDITVNFIYYEAQEADAFDVLINEFFADVTPKEGFENPDFALPTVEFVELYNRTENKVIDLNGWQIRDNNFDNTAFLGEYLLLPQSFVILCKTGKGEEFVALGYEPVLEVVSFPDLNTENDDIVLSNASANFIHGVFNYTKAWYEDEVKKEGGWTLELIDSNNPCAGLNNWRASEDLRGGTPGEANSILDLGGNPDETFPDLIRAEVVGPNTVQLFFSEIVGRDLNALNINQYNIDNGVSVDFMSTSVLNLKSIVLNVSPEIQPNQVYTITLAGDTLISDCVGNPVGMFNEVQFGIAEIAEAQDIVINEIMFYPATSTGGSDFVELYNRSGRILSLNGWCIADVNIDEDPDSLTNITPIALFNPILAEPYSMLPEQHVVLTRDAAYVQNYYSQCGTNLDNMVFIEMDLPNYDQREDVVAVINCLTFADTTTLDKVYYEDDWHYELLTDLDGVSLERIDPDGPSQNPNNWQSASAVACFATPGYQNSQFFGNITAQENITIEPESFSPDGDSFEDFLNIIYSFDEAGYTVNITIYDDRGREVRNLVQNELLGSEGMYKWDGLTNEGKKAAIGIYIIYTEIFNLQGEVQKFKDTCVVGGRLD